MPVEVAQSSTMHSPPSSNVRPKGILKNPSFSGQGGQGDHESQTQARTSEVAPTPPSMPLDPQEAKDLTVQNTIQNAGHRRSSSAARRSSASHRHSSNAGVPNSGDFDAEGHRLKWDEANLFLAEQQAGGRMKITEPKTPFEYGNNAMDEEEEEDVSIDPRFVNVDEVEMAHNKRSGKKARESEIPNMSLGEPEDESTAAGLENDRIVRPGSISREASKEKHVEVATDEDGRPEFATTEDADKHKHFEKQRKKHYEMRNVKDMLGHPEFDEEDDEDGTSRQAARGQTINGGL